MKDRELAGAEPLEPGEAAVLRYLYATLRRNRDTVPRYRPPASALRP